ncbi:MAG: ATP-grasp domain-containing protein [Spirochaetota bacterium]
MKRVLYVGGSHSDIPLINAAKDLGFYVITTGNRKEDLGHQFSHQFHPCDYSDKEAVLHLAKTLNVDYICPCCNDFSIITCAYVAQQLSLPGFDSYNITTTIHHKDAFRSFCQSHNFPVPRALSFSNIEDAVKSLHNLNFPVIVKPVDLTGGKGVSCIDTKNDAFSLIKRAFDISKEKKIVIEEYIQGSHHGLSVFLINKKVAFYFCDNEHYYINKYLVSGASCPTSVPNNVIIDLCQIYEKMASLLNLKDGIFHTQFILKDNKPYITEICRRPPGDLYVKLVEYATGVQYSHYIIKSYTNLTISDIQQKSSNGYYTRHCIMSNRPGKIKNIIIHPEIRDNIFDSLYLMNRGDVITDYLNQKAGIVFIKYNTLEEMKMKALVLHTLIQVEFEEE